MNSKLEKRVVEVFEASLDVESSNLSQWLIRECDGDEELLRRVKELQQLKPAASQLFDLDATAKFATGSNVEDRLTGKTIGDFEVEELLGAGGMGMVYKARQISLNRVVALKVLPPQLNSPHAARRFKAEMEAAARLRHPNVVSVHTTGRDQGMLYFAMDLVEGQTLGQVIRGLQANPVPEIASCPRALSATEKTIKRTATAPAATETVVQRELKSNYFDWVAATLASVADGLEYAHSLNLIHRDIKPTNLLLSSEGQVHISDFGLARDVSEPGITQTGEVLGTPYYMSPEQISASATIDSRTDVYSLGATLFELLTLQPPFPGKQRDQVLSRITSEDLVKPRKINHRIPKDLETICLKALAKRPNERYGAAREMASDLRRFLRREPIQAKRAGITERSFKWIDRHRGLATSLAALPLCIAIVATTFALKNRKLALDLLDETRRANLSTFEARIEHARAVRSTNRPTRRSESLNSIAAAFAILSGLDIDANELKSRRLLLRNEAIAALAIPELKITEQYQASSPWTVEVTFGPNYSQYAQPSSDGSVRVAKTSASETVTLPSQKNRARKMKFSSDGRYLATKHYGRGMPNGATIYVWDLEKDQQKPLISLSERRIFLADYGFSPDNSIFVAHKPGRGIEIYSLDTGELQDTIESSSESLIIEFSPNNKLAVAEHRERQLQLWNLDGEKAVLTESVEVDGEISAIGWREYPSALGVGTSKGEVHVWHTSLSDLPQVLRSHRSEIIGVHFQPAGSLLATSTLDEKVALTDLATTITQTVSASNERMHLCSGGFSSDGRKLGFFRLGEYGAWTVADSPLTALGGDRDPKLFTEVHFHPLEENIVARSTSSEIEFWDISNRTLLRSLPITSFPSFRFAPDGKHLYSASSENGLQCWPVTLIKNTAGRVEVEIGEKDILVTEQCTRLDVSQDGSVLAVSLRTDTGYDALVFDLPSHSVISKAEDIPRPREMRLSSDNTRLWICPYSRDRFCEVDVDTGKKTDTQPELPSDYLGFGASRIGDTLAFRSADELWLFRSRRWTPFVQLPLNSAPSSRVCLSANGKLAATSDGDFATQLVETKSGQVLASLSGTPSETARYYEMSSSGNRLAVAGSMNIHVWALDKLKLQLDEMKLGW